MRLAFLDTETTGTNAATGRIIEIGIIVYDHDQFQTSFSTLINPQTHIDPFITQITGIKSEDLINAPSFEDIALSLKELLSDCIIVAHNARFDYSFLKSEFRRLDIKFQSELLCTVRLSRSLYPHFHHHNLDSIIKRFNFDCPNRHRALDDAKVLVDFYQYLKSDFSSDKITSEVNRLIGHPSRPLHIPDSEIQKIPHLPGVYIFYDQQKQPLYVGKSIDLKSRVYSHFYDSVNSSREMKLATFTHFIETIPTAGELSALILESKLIKQLQPAHNRLLRQHKKMFSLHQTINHSGYFVPELKIIDNTNEFYGTDLIYQTPSFLGLFKSRRQLENHLLQISEKYQLCHILLGIENQGLTHQTHHPKKSKPCFSYHLGKCKGACIGQEKPLFYNLRFQQAFSQAKLKKWPFPGPIVVGENHPDSELSHYYLVDQWCILSEFDRMPQDTFDFPGIISPSVRTGLDLSAPQTSPESPPTFDLDTYKILLRFVLNPKNQQKIKIVGTAFLPNFK